MQLLGKEAATCFRYPGNGAEPNLTPRDQGCQNVTDVYGTPER